MPEERLAGGRHVASEFLAADGGRTAKTHKRKGPGARAWSYRASSGATTTMSVLSYREPSGFRPSGKITTLGTCAADSEGICMLTYTLNVWCDLGLAGLGIPFRLAPVPVIHTWLETKPLREAQVIRLDRPLVTSQKVWVYMRMNALWGQPLAPDRQRVKGALRTCAK